MSNKKGVCTLIRRSSEDEVAAGVNLTKPRMWRISKPYFWSVTARTQNAYALVKELS